MELNDYFIDDIKFQLTLYLSLYFLIYSNNIMINLTKIAQSKFLRPALQLTPTFNASNSNFHLKQTIQNSKSLTQFLKIFSENKQQFKSDLYANSARAICKIIVHCQERLQFNLVKDVIDSINSIDVSQIQDYQIISIISILRNLNLKGIHISAFKQILNTLAERYTELIKERQLKASDLMNLLNAFNELYYFKFLQNIKVVSQKIQNILTSNDKLIVSNNQKSYLLFCLSLKSNLSRQQKNIRKIIFKKIYEQFPRINIMDLIKIAQNLPRLDIHDMDQNELSSMNLIANKIYQNISQLDELSIFDLIRTDYLNKHEGFSKIYRQILKNIFEEISPDGVCKLNHESIIRIFNSLSDKIQFLKFNQEEKSKYVSFVEKYIVNAKNNKKQDFIVSKIQSLITNDTFDGQSRQRIMKCLTQNEIPIKNRMIYQLSFKGFNVDHLYDQLKTIDYAQSKVSFLIKQIIVINRIKQNKPEATQLFDQLYSQIQQKFNSPQKFRELILQLSNTYNKQQINLYRFNYIFQKSFENLPNPFESEGHQRKYRQIYLEYIMMSYPMKDCQNFVNKYLRNINQQEFGSIIYRFTQRDNRYIKPLVNYTYLVNQKLIRNPSDLSKKLLASILQYISSLLRFVVYDISGNYQQVLLFDSLDYLISNFEKVQQLQLTNLFISIVERYIKCNFRNYKYEHRYRDLLFKLLRHINKFLSKDRFVSAVLRQALNLNIVTQKNLENVDIDKLSLGYIQKARLYYIKDVTYVPKIQKINDNSIKLIVSNPNLQEYLAENQQQIIQRIKRSYSNQLISFLVSFRLKISPKTFKILQAICQNIVDKVSKFQKYDIVGISNSILNLSSNSIGPVRKLVMKISENIKYNVGFISLENQCEIIRLFTATAGLNLLDYYNYLSQYINKSPKNEGIVEKIYYRLAATSYQLKDSELKIVFKILPKNVYHGIYFFLMNEMRYDQTARNEIVSNIVTQIQKINSRNQQKSNANNFGVKKIFYDYIKKAYPEQTQELNLQRTSGYRFSGKPRKQLIPLLTELSGVQPQAITQFGQNIILKFKNHVMIFLNEKKLGAFNEHYFLKRAIPFLLGQSELNVICIGNVMFPSTINYVNKECPGLLIQQKFNNYIAEINKKKQSRSSFKKQQKQ